MSVIRCFSHEVLMSLGFLAHSLHASFPERLLDFPSLQLTRMKPKSVHNDYLCRYMNAAIDFLMKFSEEQT